jgi:hypothetical protein
MTVTVQSGIKEAGAKAAEARAQPGPLKTVPGIAERGHFIDRAEFDERVKDLVFRQSVLFPGKAFVISLSKVRERFGSKWPRIAERAHPLVREAVERHLTGRDIFTRFRDLDYLVVFANHTDEEALLKVTLIAMEVSKRLSGGDAAMKVLVVRKAADFTSGEIIFEDLGTAEVVARRLEDGEASSESDVQPRSQGDPQSTQFMYRPLWYVRHRLLASYLCLPARPLPSGRVLTGYETLPGGTQSSRVAELDLATLRRVRDELTKLVKGGRKMLLACPVHQDTLAAGKSGKDYLSLYQSLPEALRKMVMIELVFGADVGSLDRLPEAALALSGLCRSLIARLPRLGARLPQLSHAGLESVGVDLGSASDPEARILGDMTQFAEWANAEGLKTFVHGLNSLSLTSAAIGAGFDYVDGSVVTSIPDTPQGVQPFNLEDMYAHLVA